MIKKIICSILGHKIVTGPVKWISTAPDEMPRYRVYDKALKCERCGYILAFKEEKN